MNRRAAYTSHRRLSLRLKKRLMGVAVLAAASCVAVLALLLKPDQVLVARAGVADTTVPALPVPAATPPSQAPTSPTIARRVYPYSIIPGGVSGREELARAIKTDKVVAAHYASFDVDKAVKLTVAKPRAVHVSYRKGDKVYWTAKKLMLAEGETLLSDGNTELRARCANRISDVPQLPVELNEPTAEELDSVVNVSMDTAELGLDDADVAADGFMNGLGFALASSEPPSSIKVAGKSLASRSGNPATLIKVEPVPGRRSIVRSVPGKPASENTAATPIIVPPTQGQTGDKGVTPGPPATPGSKPSTQLPEVRPPEPDSSTTPGPDGTPLLPPLSPEPPPWRPGNLPEQPGENVHEVPEPGTLSLSAAAFAGMLLLRRKYRARPAIRD